MTARGAPISNSLYRRLKPIERFRLAIDAYARGDFSELKRLSDTCPEQKYWCQEVNYSEPMKASVVIALSAANLLLRARLAFEPAIDAKEMRDGIHDVLREHCSAAIAAKLELDDEYALIERVYSDRASDLVGVCEGIRRFSGRIGLLPEKLLSLEPNCLVTWGLACRLAEAHPCNGALADAVDTRLSALWTALVPSGPADVSAPAA